MRSVAITLFFFICVQHIRSQDTIHFLNKSAQTVKVSEIGIDEIKYQRFDNLDGPLYVSAKRDIHYIKFANGHVDTLTSLTVVKPVVANQIISVHMQKPPISTDGKIFINRDKLSYNGIALNEMGLYKLISAEPNAEKKKTLMKEYDKMNGYKKKQYLFGFVGLGAGLLLPTIGFALSNSTNDAGPFVLGVGAGMAIGISGAVLSGIHKHLRTKQKISVATLYNNQ